MWPGAIPQDRCNITKHSTWQVLDHEKLQENDH